MTLHYKFPQKFKLAKEAVLHTLYCWPPFSTPAQSVLLYHPRFSETRQRKI